MARKDESKYFYAPPVEFEPVEFELSSQEPTPKPAPTANYSLGDSFKELEYLSMTDLGRAALNYHKSGGNKS